jgi:hypothetical protein
MTCFDWLIWSSLFSKHQKAFKLWLQTIVEAENWLVRRLKLSDPAKEFAFHLLHKDLLDPSKREAIEGVLI